MEKLTRTYQAEWLREIAARVPDPSQKLLRQSGALLGRICQGHEAAAQPECRSNTGLAARRPECPMCLLSLPSRHHIQLRCRKEREIIGLIGHTGLWV